MDEVSAIPKLMYILVRRENKNKKTN
jgi:hypothetical protein